LALEGALAVAVAFPGAGELEADPGLADDGHEPGAVAVCAQAGWRKVGLWTQCWICREFVGAWRSWGLPLSLLGKPGCGTSGVVQQSWRNAAIPEASSVKTTGAEES
jgi:hypothetical protein